MMISVIIPTYNRSSLLKRALESLAVQTDQEFEVVIADDTSTDDTAEVVRDFYPRMKKIIYFKLGRNSGVNGARNEAIRRSSGDWLAFLDDDDEFMENAIEIIKKNVDKVPKEYNIAYFNAIADTGTLRYESGYQFSDGEEYFDPSYYDTMTKRGLKGDCKLVIRASLCKEGGYWFPESVNGFESYTMSLIARDKKGIRYFKEKTTLIHLDDSIPHLSFTAPKRPQALLSLHSHQISQHWKFYISHPQILFKKIVAMIKLLWHSVSSLSAQS
jgi:glycosyltransferase involved in cell wall biosynthesis